MNNGRCIATNKRGKPCDAKPLNGGDLCFFHHPNKADQRKAASAAGGKAGTLKTLAPDYPWVKVRRPGDVVELAEAIVNYTLRGEISPQAANAIAIHLRLGLDANERQIGTERLKAIELLVEDDGDDTRDR